jgi:uncharacterized protein YukE
MFLHISGVSDRRALPRGYCGQSFRRFYSVSKPFSSAFARLSHALANFQSFTHTNRQSFAFADYQSIAFANRQSFAFANRQSIALTNRD